MGIGYGLTVTGFQIMSVPACPAGALGCSLLHLFLRLGCLRGHRRIDFRYFDHNILIPDHLLPAPSDTTRRLS